MSEINNNAVKKLKIEIKNKAQMHLDASKFYQKCNLSLNIISILLGAVSSLIGTIFNKSNQQVYIFLVVVHWLVTTMVTINHVFKFSIKEQKHYSSFRQYSNLSDELDLVILDPENNNLSKVENDFRDINLQEPELPVCYCCCTKENTAVY